MRRIIVENREEEVDVYINYENNDEELIKCEILPNDGDGTFIEYWPNEHFNQRDFLIFDKSKSCSIMFDEILMRDAGIWKIRSTFKSNLTIVDAIEFQVYQVSILLLQSMVYSWKLYF